MPPYSSYYPYASYDSSAAVGLAAAGAFVIILYLAIIGIGIVSYILRSLALYRIAKRRGIPNPFLSWIPVASSYLAGEIAEEYDKRNGHKRNWSKVLLTLSVITAASLILVYVVMFAVIIPVAYYGLKFTAAIVVPVILMYVLLIAAGLVATANMVCEVICIFKIFESTVPQKALKYILIYTLVPLGGPICLFKCKEEGYSNVQYPGYENPQQ